MSRRFVASVLAAALAGLAPCGGPGALLGQEATGELVAVPPDTYADEATRSLVARARRARRAAVEGIRSYEGVMRERIYVGLTALRFRRERGLFEQERVARLRWEADGDRAIHWLAARQAIPVVGADTRRAEVEAQGRVGAAGSDVRDELRQELPRELLRELELPGFVFDPHGDRMAFGESWALNPMADTAASEYRYAPGDTLVLTLPDGRRIVLLEVRVTPRRSDFRLVAGSLWFDEESASLVRATYKPARPFDLGMDEPEDASEVPAFLKPVQAEISYVAVEYSLYEFRYWLPRRFALQGEARLGRFARLPLTVEWSLREYEVNREESEIPLRGPLPPGWARREGRVRGGAGVPDRFVTVIVPEPAELLTSARLSEPSGERTPAAFTDAEIAELRGTLEGLLPEYQPLRPTLHWGLDRSMVRFNRVEGLSLGAEAEVPLTPDLTAAVQARVGTGDRQPYGALTLWRGPEDARWHLRLGREVAFAGDYGAPFSLTSSALHLLTGQDRNFLYRRSAASAGYTRRGARTRWSVEGFGERHNSTERTTTFYLLEPFSEDTVPANPRADRADVLGARARIDWFRGIDPNGWILTAGVRGEVGWGDATYQRIWARASAGHPLPFGLAGAVEVSGGTLVGDVLAQHRYFLGGTETLRGIDQNELAGEAFWRVRGELGSGFAGARVALFSDVGWAGPGKDFGLTGRVMAVGVGGSFLDGLVRIDLARSVRGAGKWKAYLYFDGLF